MPRGPVVDQWPDNHAHEIVPGVWLGDFESAMDVQSCSTRRISKLLCADKRAGAAVSAERGRSKSGNATSQRAAESGLIKKTESLVLPLDSMSKTPITTKIVIQLEPPDPCSRALDDAASKSQSSALLAFTVQNVVECAASHVGSILRLPVAIKGALQPRSQLQLPG